MEADLQQHSSSPRTSAVRRGNHMKHCIIAIIPQVCFFDIQFAKDSGSMG